MCACAGEARKSNKSFCGCNVPSRIYPAECNYPEFSNLKAPLNVSCLASTVQLSLSFSSKGDILKLKLSPEENLGKVKYLVSTPKPTEHHCNSPIDYRGLD